VTFVSNQKVYEKRKISDFCKVEKKYPTTLLIGRRYSRTRTYKSAKMLRACQGKERKRFT